MAKSEPTTWVFCNCKGNIKATVTQLNRIPNVQSITPVTGRFDIVIKLRTNNPTNTLSCIEKIRNIKNITATQTATSFQKVTNGDTDKEQPMAFALVKVKGAFRNVLSRLKSFPNFLEAHVIPGEFDIVASFQGFNQDEVLETSVEKLGSINGVTASETLIAWNPTTPF